MGIDVKEEDRNLAFCSYTILEDSPDVLVVPDATLDERFKNNPYVSGPASIRFYAGAALIVNSQKIGSFCVIDMVPHLDFGMDEKRNLLDISASISQLIDQRRSHYLELEKEKTVMTLAATQSLKIPEMITNLCFQSMVKAYESCTLESSWAEESGLIALQVKEFLDSLTNLLNSLEMVTTLTTAIPFYSDKEITSSLVKKMSVLNTLQQDNTDNFLERIVNRLQLSLPNTRINCTNCSSIKNKTALERVIETHYNAISYLIYTALLFPPSNILSIDIQITFRKSEYESLTDLPDFVSVVIIYKWEEKLSRRTKDIITQETNSTMERLKKILTDSVLQAIHGRCTISDKDFLKYLIPAKALDLNQSPQKEKRIAQFFRNTLTRMTSTNIKSTSLGGNESAIVEDQLALRRAEYDDDMLIDSDNEMDETREVSISPIKHSMVTKQDKNFNDKPLSVLVIEDTLSTQKLVKRWLVRNKCIVDCAENGLIGFNLLKNKVYDLVVLDFLMVS